jgi:nicotinate-nucleotide adenylyltransferase
MRLGILGGTFDPVHYGHLLLAECCREQCRLDAVWFLPAAVPPHKQGRELTRADWRIAMLELAIAGHEAFAVCRYETDRGGVNYTADTLAHLQAEDPQRQLFFLLGADMLHDLPKWHEPVRICQIATLVPVRRAGEAPLDLERLAGVATAAQIAEMRAHAVEMPAIELSASDLRCRVAQGLGIRYRTPRAVEKFIETHALYR